VWVAEENRRTHGPRDGDLVNLKLEGDESTRNACQDEGIWRMDKVRKALPQPRTVQLDLQLDLAIRVQAPQASRYGTRYLEYPRATEVEKWVVSPDDAFFSIELA